MSAGEGAAGVCGVRGEVGSTLNTIGALHAPIQWAIQGYVIAEEGVIECPCREPLGAAEKLAQQY